MSSKQKITVQGTPIKLFHQQGKDFISLTDIAKQVDQRSDQVIQNWLRNAGTLDFLYEWEVMYNAGFKPLKFEGFRKNAGKVGFVMTPKRWIEGTDAIGITSKSGRYGGTYAHKDIAFEFCSAISAKFKLYLIQEFERLKAAQLQGVGEQWNVNRYLSKINYYIHTEAVQTERIPLLEQGTKKQGLYYAVEADMLNLIIFGTTAKQWKQMNTDKKGNIRDHASIIELQVLANLEVLNAELLKLGMNQQDREDILTNAAQRHTDIIQDRAKKKLH